MAQHTKTGRLRPTARSLLDALRDWLTPAVYKQARQARAATRRPPRWHTQPLILTLLALTGCCGDSLPERFETARAFCVACLPRRRRPGRTVPGFQKALAWLPLAALRLYVDGPAPGRDFSEGLVYCWPQAARDKKLPPLPCRLIRVRGKKGRVVWLLTDVLDAGRLPREAAARYYHWRWESEGLFRTYKRTLAKVKLLGRTVRLVHREAEGSLLATQALLAWGAQAVGAGRGGGSAGAVQPAAGAAGGA